MQLGGRGQGDLVHRRDSPLAEEGVVRGDVDD